MGKCHKNRIKKIARKEKLRVMILRCYDVKTQDVQAQNDVRIEERINGFKDGKERVKWGGAYYLEKAIDMSREISERATFNQH